MEGQIALGVVALLVVLDVLDVLDVLALRWGAESREGSAGVPPSPDLMLGKRDCR
jgi:hypothetical protein